MNKKLIGLLIIFLVAILAIGSVEAANLKNHDFDGYFSMKVPKDANFQKENESVDGDEVYDESVSYSSEHIGIAYFQSFLLSENSSTWFYQTIFESLCPDLDECYETQEGNLVILEPKKIDETHMAIVGISSGNKMLMIMADDVDLAKEMANSVKFN